MLVLSHLSILHSSSRQYFPYLSKFCTLLLTLLVLSLPPVWSRLPGPKQSGIKRRLRQCADCCQSLLSKAPVISCCFRQSGFDGFIPCGTRYHVKCIKAEPPFHSWRKDNLGLAFPASIKSWRNFICEACTICSITQQEIETKNDSYLLQLERMWLIDMSWYWSQGTHASYQSKL